MARRVIYVGGLAEVEALRPEYKGRLCPDGDYLFGRYCDVTPEAGLKRLDLMRACRLAKLTARQRAAVMWAWELVPLREIARRMGVHPSTAKEFIVAGHAKLDNLPPGELGCLTVIYEECGGMEAALTYLRLHCKD